MNNRLTIRWLLVFFGLTLLNPFRASALSEVAYFEHYYDLARKFFSQGDGKTQVTHGTFPGVDQVPIAYRKFDVQDEKGLLVVLPGRGEPLVKYAEVIYDLRDLGYSIYLLEHRGQGESGSIAGCQIQYVEDFDKYLDDLSIFMKEIVRVDEHPKRFLLAHSMGGAIGALYAIKRDPTAFRAAVLTAPLFDMYTPGFCSKKVAHDFAWMGCKIGLAKKRATTDREKLTSSEVRQEMGETVASYFIEWKSKEISYQWVLSALNGIEEIKKSAQSYSIPTLILQAGKDRHVPAQGQNEFCDWAKDCVSKTYAEAYHELLMENDTIRDQVLRDIRDYLKKF